MPSECLLHYERAHDDRKLPIFTVPRLPNDLANRDRERISPLDGLVPEPIHDMGSGQDEHRDREYDVDDVPMSQD